MVIVRALAPAVVMAWAAVGLASPASAELTDGTYQMTYLASSGPAPRTLLVTSCGVDCKQVQIEGPYTPEQYHLNGNAWTTSDGTKTINNDTLAGTANTWAIQLTKNG